MLTLDSSSVNTLAVRKSVMACPSQRNLTFYILKEATNTRTMEILSPCLTRNIPLDPGRSPGWSRDPPFRCRTSGCSSGSWTRHMARIVYGTGCTWPAYSCGPRSRTAGRRPAGCCCYTPPWWRRGAVPGDGAWCHRQKTGDSGHEGSDGSSSSPAGAPRPARRHGGERRCPWIVASSRPHHLMMVTTLVSVCGLSQSAGDWSTVTRILWQRRAGGLLNNPAVCGVYMHTLLAIQSPRSADSNQAHCEYQTRQCTHE